MTTIKHAKFSVGQVVQHRLFPFRGLIFDIDPEFANTDEWWLAIPEEIRPAKDQPFYHLYAENADNTYEAYVSERNSIQILMKSGELLDVAQASDLPHIKAMSKIVKKNYLCWPKNLSL